MCAGQPQTVKRRLAALADINRENAEVFAGQYGNAAVCADYRGMLEAAEMVTR